MNYAGGSVFVNGDVLALAYLCWRCSCVKRDEVTVNLPARVHVVNGDAVSVSVPILEP